MQAPVTACAPSSQLSVSGMRAAAACALFVPAAAGAGGDPVVVVDGVGALRGAASGGVASFLGVPYAAPPTSEDCLFLNVHVPE
eukprot:gene26123-51073_t